MDMKGQAKKKALTMLMGRKLKDRIEKPEEEEKEGHGLTIIIGMGGMESLKDRLKKMKGK